MEANRNTHYEEDNKVIVTYLTGNDLKAKYAKILAEKHDVHRQASIPKVRYIAPLMKYAAIGILLISTIFVTKQYLWEVSPRQMAMQHIQDTNILGDPSSMRKDNEFIEQTRIDANYAFVNRNYNESLRLYENIIKSKEVLNDDYFYLGVSYLRSSKPDAKAAMAAFDKIESNSSLMNETRWFKSLAMIIDGDTVAAKELLHQIVTSKGFKHREAKELFESI